MRWEEDKYITLNYIRYQVFRLELNGNDLIVYDFREVVRFPLLNIEDISNYLNDSLGERTGKKFLIYAQCKLI